MPKRFDLLHPPVDGNMPRRRRWIPAVLAAAFAAVAALLLDSCSKQNPAAAAASTSPFADTNGMTTLEAAQSVVVTHDLDITNGATLADVVREIERHYKPDDGVGRTFAVLEAFNGTIQPDGRMRVSLRISSEKPGLAAVTYRRSREPLWKSRITPATHKSGFTAGSLTILFDAGAGQSFTVDGSMNPPSILDAMLKESGVPVAQAWPEGEGRDLSFIYSACGCPIHVKCRRTGDRTVRTEEATQVIFPDDPPAVQLINRLMRW